MKKLKQIYDKPLHKDIRELVKYSAEHYSLHNAFVIKHKINKEISYEYINYTRFYKEINALGTALLKRGYSTDPISIIGSNSYKWILSYFATVCGLGICVPLDKDLPIEELESSILRSHSKVIVFDSAHGDKIKEIKGNDKTGLTLYISMEPFEDFMTVDQLLDEGYKAIEDGSFEYQTKEIDPNALAIILFTSGTTSMSKAVMLSHHNIVANVYSTTTTEPFFDTDINMAFLPYHHTFGSTGQVIMIASGACTAYCDGIKYLQKNLVEYNVSIFICVPLLIESIYKKIIIQAEKQGKLNLVKMTSKFSGGLLKVGIDVRRKLFKSILDQLGGNLRFIISGASACDPAALKGFNDFGILTVQGYGLTETSPVLTAENAHNIRVGSVGKPVPNVKIKINDPNVEGIGEVWAKGPNIMAGYYENKEETDKVLKYGWFHTGDLGYIDKDGFLFLSGRKKNVIVLKSGKNVYPEEVELLVSNLPYVIENMVFGQPKHDDETDLALCLKIVYDKEYFTSKGNVVDDIRPIIEKDIEEINDTLPVYKQIRRIIITEDPMIKTTTGKVKRFEEMKNL